MTVDWCPGIREVCAYWPDTPMLQQTFEALERSLDDDNDTCIDCSKAVVEVVCRLMVGNFESGGNSLAPQKTYPSLSEWLSAAVKALKLGETSDREFDRLVSAHHGISDALNRLRNRSGPAIHFLIDWRFIIGAWLF